MYNRFKRDVFNEFNSWVASDRGNPYHRDTIKRLYQWRNNCVRVYLNKPAKIIIDHCLKHQIGKLIVGYNPGIKQEINIGRSNNQNFVQIPFWQLRRKLETLCSRYGIEDLEQEESYTSGASFYDKVSLLLGRSPIKLRAIAIASNHFFLKTFKISWFIRSYTEFKFLPSTIQELFSVP